MPPTAQSGVNVNDINDIPNAVPSSGNDTAQSGHQSAGKRSSRHSHFQAATMHSPTNAANTHRRPTSSHHRLLAQRNSSVNVSDESLFELAHMRAIIHDEHHAPANAGHHHHRESTHFMAATAIAGNAESERVTALEQKVIELTGKLDLLMSMQGLHHHNNKHNSHNTNNNTTSNNNY